MLTYLFHQLYFVVAMLEKERQRIEQLTAGWDDPSQADWGSDEPQAIDSTSQQPTADSSAPSVVYKCVALYTYSVSIHHLLISSTFSNNYSTGALWKCT